MPTTNYEYDVFLSYAERDQSVADELARRLTERGVKVWERSPGMIFLEELKKDITRIRAVAILLGEAGIKRPREEEIWSWFSMFFKRDFPVVIPVKLWDYRDKCRLPVFLNQTPVELDCNLDEGLEQLIAGIKGQKHREPRKTLSLSMSTHQRIQENIELQSPILDLRRQYLVEVPKEVFELGHLEELWLEDNAIQIVPEELGNRGKLPKLKIIDLRINPLRVIANIPGLVLDWNTWNNNRESLSPGNIAGLWLRWQSDEHVDELLRLPSLRWLDLSYSQLKTVPTAIRRLDKLSFLDLSNNELAEIPDFLSSLRNLASLKLGKNKISKIPDYIGDMRNLRLLELFSNNISEFPESITRLPELKSLNLGSNPLRNIPDSIGRLNRLTSLSLGDTQLGAIPSIIFQLRSLRSLSLWKNQIKTIPESIANLQNLSDLNFEDNNLSVIPDFISDLSRLRSLRLGKNQIRDIPHSVTRLTNLVSLNLWCNQLTAFPEPILLLRSLRNINLEDNQIKSLPPAITQLANLTELSLGGNPLNQFPEPIIHLRNLRLISLWGTGIKTLPNSITRLTDLRHLNLEDNQIHEFPESVTRLPKLTSLWLGGNQMNSIPNSITKVKHLAGLRLWKNQFRTIPEPISQLTNLIMLNLDENQISEIPEPFNWPKSLAVLRLGGNKIRSIPESIWKLENLRELNLANNPIAQPEIFFSYAWQGESERIAEEIENTLKEWNPRLNIIRDKKALPYKGNITEYMQTLGAGQYIVVIISDKYLKSRNCMFELLEIAKHGEIHERIYPVVLGDAAIYNEDENLTYIEYWEKKISDLDNRLRKVGTHHLERTHKTIDLYVDIRTMFSSLTETLARMNVLTPEMHRGNNFKHLLDALAKSMGNDNLRWSNL